MLEKDRQLSGCYKTGNLSLQIVKVEPLKSIIWCSYYFKYHTSTINKGIYVCLISRPETDHEHILIFLNILLSSVQIKTLFPVYFPLSKMHIKRELEKKDIFSYN